MFSWDKCGLNGNIFMQTNGWQLKGKLKKTTAQTNA
jgi:hypothetical protein